MRMQKLKFQNAKNWPSKKQKNRYGVPRFPKAMKQLRDWEGEWVCLAEGGGGFCVVVRCAWSVGSSINSVCPSFSRTPHQLSCLKQEDQVLTRPIFDVLWYKVSQNISPNLSKFFLTILPYPYFSPSINLLITNVYENLFVKSSKILLVMY